MSHTCTIEGLLASKITPNWTKDFPVAGQGTLVFSIQRSTPFFIVVRPKLPQGEPGADQWICLTVKKDKAMFSLGMDNEPKLLSMVTGTVKNEHVGFEENRKISYWLSYDRDHLTIKYGKGYRMEDTTLMTYDFLKDVANHEEEREKLKYLFSPEIRRKIEQYDMEEQSDMIQKYANIIKTHGYRGVSLASMLSNSGIVSTNALEQEAIALSKSLIDIESEVAFDKNPLVCDWSPIVLDSSQVNLFELDSNNYTFSASLPTYCLELYSNVTAPNVELDWSPTDDKYRLSDAIRFSLKGPNGTLYKKLVSKTDEFGSIEQTYLRVTLGVNRGSSPGIPYVLEIWPVNHGSPIHNHGNSYAVIKVLHGGLSIKLFNKHTDTLDAIPLKKFDVKKGDITWISPNWFQTHQLWNSTNDYCATIQCYQYGLNDFTEWPYFDYVADTSVIDEFLPDSDYTFQEMRKIVMKEFQEFMDAN